MSHCLLGLLEWDGGWVGKDETVGDVKINGCEYTKPVGRPVTWARRGAFGPMCGALGPICVL